MKEILIQVDLQFKLKLLQGSTIYTIGSVSLENPNTLNNNSNTKLSVVRDIKKQMSWYSLHGTQSQVAPAQETVSESCWTAFNESCSFSHVIYSFIAKHFWIPNNSVYASEEYSFFRTLLIIQKPPNHSLYLDWQFLLFLYFFFNFSISTDLKVVVECGFPFRKYSASIFPQASNSWALRYFPLQGQVGVGWGWGVVLF